MLIWLIFLLINVYILRIILNLKIKKNLVLIEDKKWFYFYRKYL